MLGNAIASSIPAIHTLFNGDTIRQTMFLPYPFEVINIRIDPLAAWFILIINLTCVNGAFQVSMLWVCILQHGLAFLLAWEIMSISSLLLLMFERSKQEVLTAGVNYLIQMHIGAALCTIAFLRIYHEEGSFHFTYI